jgi:hypothetical protein
MGAGGRSGCGDVGFTGKPTMGNEVEGGSSCCAVPGTFMLVQEDWPDLGFHHHGLSMIESVNTM